MQSLHNCIWQFQHLSTTYHLQNPVKADRLCFSMTICPTKQNHAHRSQKLQSLQVHDHHYLFSTFFSAKKMSCLHCPQTVTTHTFCLETLPSKPEKRVTFPPKKKLFPHFFPANLTQNLKQKLRPCKKKKYSNNAARPQNTIQFIARISWKCRIFFI